MFIITEILINFINLVNAINLNNKIVIDLVIIFSLNAFATTLGNLKTIFLSKKLIKPVYGITFIDAIIFAYAFKLIANSEGLLFILAFAIGRLTGVFLSDIIEEKLALGSSEITIYKHLSEGIELADKLRNMGYSVTTYKGYGIQGQDRLVLEVICPRSEVEKVKEAAAKEGLINMAIKDTKPFGKLGKINQV